MNNEQYKERRKALGLNQIELAALLGVTPRTVKRREKSGSITIEAEIAIQTLNPLKTS